MANELAIKVKVELDTNRQYLNEQFKKVREYYTQNPIKLAFTADPVQSRKNVNAVLKSMVTDGKINVPTIELKFKVNNKELSSQIKAALKSADTTVSSNPSQNKEYQKQLSDLFGLRKKANSLEIKQLNTPSNNTIVLQELQRQIDDTYADYNKLRAALVSNLDTSAIEDFTRREQELNKSLENGKKLAQANVVSQQSRIASAYDHTGVSIEQLKTRMDDYLSRASDLEVFGADLIKLQALYKSFNETANLKTFNNEEDRARALRDIINAAGHEMNNLSVQASKVKGSIKQDTGFSNLSSQIRDFLDATPRIKEDSDLYSEFLTLLDQSENHVGNIDSLRKSYAKLRDDTKDLGLETETVYGKLKRLFGEHFQTAIVMAGIHALQQGLQVVYQNIVDIDTAMTELKKVTDETDQTYSDFLDGAADQARNLGASISDYISSTAEWARLGYDLADSQELARVATLYKNVGDGISSATEASEYLISTLKGFNLMPKDAEHVLDVINEVANTQPVSAQGLGEILTRSSAAMAAANNTFEETIALGTAMNSVLQDEEKTGTTLKTVSMYLRAAKTDAEAAGEATDGMASSVSELRSELLALTNNRVDIMSDPTTYKSTYQILKDLAEVWDSISDIDQANILEMLGGKRNANAVAAVLEQFDIAEKSLESASTAAGSAIAENEKYLDSVAGKISQMNAAMEGLSNTLLDSGVVKFFIDFATASIKAADGVVEFTGALPLLTTALTSAFSVGEPKMTGFQNVPTNTLMVTWNELAA